MYVYFERKMKKMPNHILYWD